MVWNVDTFGATDVGLMRENNEDHWKELPSEQFYVLCDGMGGHRAGEVASEEAVKVISYIIKDRFTEEPSIHDSLEEMQPFLEEAITQTNSVVYSFAAADDALKGMGTTLCCLLVHSEGVLVGNVGDSRVYRFRKKQLEQLTMDHTLEYDVAEFDPMEQVSPTILRKRNIITRSIGNEPQVKPDVDLHDAEEGDLYLLCSDGLTDMVPHAEIEEILSYSTSLEKCAEDLITRAKAKGGNDNITILLVELNENLPR